MTYVEEHIDDDENIKIPIKYISDNLTNFTRHLAK